MDFAHILRDLRTKSGIGIKKLAPDLGVSYTYLSKLEHGRVRPSQELVERVATYFEYDQDELLLASDYVPLEVLEILRAHPRDAVRTLRDQFGPRA